jgi:NadR type nicotinamide-nucleotide adenylyltransferase
MMGLTVVLVGAESTGKTTLASALADVLGAPWVSEFARDYLNAGMAYEATDVLAIAKGQHAAEQQALLDDPLMLIVDTDLLVTRIWSEVRFGFVDPWIVRALAAANAGARSRLYLLPQPDIPWRADPLRESAGERDALHARYRQALTDMNADFVEIGGEREERLSAAVATIRRRQQTTASQPSTD